MGLRWRRSDSAKCEIKAIGAVWWRHEDGAQGGSAGRWLQQRSAMIPRWVFDEMGFQRCFWWQQRNMMTVNLVEIFQFGGCWLGDLVLGIWVGFDLWVSGYCVAEDRFTVKHEGEWWVLRWVLFVWGYWKG